MNDEWLEPYFGPAPSEYSQAYMDNLVRQLTTVLAQIHTVGEIDISSLIIRRLPTTGVNSVVGTVYSSNGFLKVVDYVPAASIGITGYAPTVVVA